MSRQCPRSSLCPLASQPRAPGFFKYHGRIDGRHSDSPEKDAALSRIFVVWRHGDRMDWGGLPSVVQHSLPRLGTLYCLVLEGQKNVQDPLVAMLPESSVRKRV